MRIILFFTVLMTLLTAAFLFRVKHEVISIERRVVQLSGNISLVQREMNILRNELAHLIQPARMALLMKQSSGATLRKEQLVSAAQLSR